MQKLKTSEIRKSFVDYFKSRDHKEYDSSPVIPFDDPTLLFINAGMNQFKDIFTGRKKAEYPRVVTVQKCMRAGGKHNDLENVGRTDRHHTFFEMLGNFSFGDYFKEEAIYYGWEWVTKILQLPVDRLYATVFIEDEEAFRIWEKVAPELRNGHILRFDEKDNYWSMGEVGPNGPCSEIHFDRGEKFGVGPAHTVNGESERFVEIWNLVFMQYNARPDGTSEPLPKPSVDTGAGLERITCVMMEGDSDYEIDVFAGLIDHISGITGRRYHTDQRGVSHRVIADHIRALSFCIADGGGLSNEKQGYVLRRILRRAARHGRLLNMHEPFMFRLVPTLISLMGDVYPELGQKQTHIENVIQSEEENFGRTLDTGLELFDSVARKLKASGNRTVPGEDVFKLYDTYGFPVDLTRVMAEEQDMVLDMDGFERMMKRQQEQSRGATLFGDSGAGQWQLVVDEALKQLPAEKLKTEFVRDRFEVKSGVVEMFELSGDSDKMLAVVPERSPFYVEAGGQAGDHGYIIGDLFKIQIDHLVKYKDAIVHIGRFIEKKYTDIEELGKVEVILRLDEHYRLDVMRNHTATHLLHAALREVLGTHVHQSGSYVGADKLRFDFSHFRAMTPDEISQVEKLVNDKILEGSPVSTVEDDLDDARKSGAMAIFGEKYESRVRVVSVGDFSRELCGGTHVENVMRIGPFLITVETGIASGVRRVEAVTGRAAMQLILAQKESFAAIARLVNRPAEEVSDAVAEVYGKYVELQKENKRLRAERYAGGGTAVGTETRAGETVLRYHDFGQADWEEMAGWVDSGKGAGYPLVTMAIGLINGKRTFMMSASGSVKRHMGDLARVILEEFGGKGGGKPNFAQGSIPPEVNSTDVFQRVAGKLK
jgi:alanyl-tRNA synthetase